MNNKLNEGNIADILLCDPVTEKGNAALKRLGLSEDEINPKFFYQNLYVKSKYDKETSYLSNQAFEDEKKYLYYQYTVSRKKYNELKKQSEEFESRFFSDGINEYPLIMLGVAGNGKSIDVNRKIYDPYYSSDNNDFSYIDLEESFTKKTYGVTYHCPDNKKSYWLFCIKILDEIMQYIKKHEDNCETIYNNFKKYIARNHFANDLQKEVFTAVKNYHYNNEDSVKNVFISLKELLHSINAEEDIQALLEILLWIMFCSSPEKKHYIIIDNIEQYIKLNEVKVQIPNSDIALIYNTLNLLINNVKADFNSIEDNLIWKAFKIVIVLRRTSIGLLDSTFLQATLKADKNINDITGHFQLPDIWEKKKKYIWENRLKTDWGSPENNIKISILDVLMNDGTKAIGTGYQLLIAPLMSYGIRRNAKSQAHAAEMTYAMLTNNNNRTLNIDEFNHLLSNASGDNSTVRYMFRRALMEFQFKWPISNGKKERWEHLNLGHVIIETTANLSSGIIQIEKIDYDDRSSVSLVRRILTCLSCYTDVNNRSNNGKSKAVSDMFATISLYDLMKGVFYNPVRKWKVNEEIMLQFAKVLISLSNMSNGDTKCAPFIILGVKDMTFHEESSYESLASVLMEILNSINENKELKRKYNCCDYGVRLTDAGHSFLLDWQASFSFMAALYCHTIPPLFFLKDIEICKYVIKTVYNHAIELCEMYENEAKRFCEKDVTLKKGTYLPKRNGNYVTFKQRVKELHTNHLYLYKTYLENNYSYLQMSDGYLKNLIRYIDSYIQKYNSWNTGEKECF